MSNAQYRSAQPSAQPSAAPLMRSRAELLIRQTMYKLYNERGGLGIEFGIRMCEAALENAAACRESEGRRLKENPDAQREERERPMMTCSEGRAHGRDYLRFLKEKDALRSQIENQINQRLEAAQPTTEAALIEALSGMAEDTAFTPDQPAQPQDDEAIKAGEVAREILSQVSPDARRKIMHALSERNFALVSELTKALPPELKAKLDTLIGAPAMSP